MRWKYASVGLSQTSMFDECSFFAKTHKDFYLLTAAVKSTISDVWQGSEYIRLLHLPQWKFSLHPLNVMFDRFLFFCQSKKSLLLSMKNLQFFQNILEQLLYGTIMRECSINLVWQWIGCRGTPPFHELGSIPS